MSRERIIGREQECARLNECMEDGNSQLIIVYGRRRVGKTYLINEFFDNQFTFKMTGAYGQPKKIQLRNFATELNRSFHQRINVPKDWLMAFDALRDCLEKNTDGRKQIIFFDEMPWLDTQKSGFLAAFEYFWNSWASARHDIICIVCGSATAWMVDNLADNKGGLYSRQSCRIYLKPFCLKEVEAFLNSKNIQWSHYEIAQCYMIMGGIPYYLSLLSNKLSFCQNIDRLFFKDRGELWDEFDHLYKTLFANSNIYIRLVEALSKKNRGLTRNEIIESTGIATNGMLSKMLKNLIDSGFVRISGFYSKKKKEAIYQLADYYTTFYFRYIKENYGKDEHYWSNSIDNPSRRAWAGLTFEQLCKDHLPQIKSKLGISGVLTSDAVWYSRGNDELGTDGVQIDLLIDRRDQVINICEMKFSINEYIIDKDYDLALRNKVEAFRRMNDCKKSLQITMITTYGVKNNKYSGIVQSQVVLSDLFCQPL